VDLEYQHFLLLPEPVCFLASCEGSGFFLLNAVLDTLIQSGGIPIRLGPPRKGMTESSVLEPGRPRETRIFKGKTYVMETALRGDVAILRAWKVDKAGNCQFRCDVHSAHSPGHSG
jgi:acyl CoA:acetate/3-ketoacid CoA transferase alpha subunit